MRKTAKILSYVIAFLILNTVCKTLTANFSPQLLVPPDPPDSLFAQDCSTQPPTGALHQKYTYLGKGKQAYVFASEDGQYVLKVFKPYFPNFTVHFLKKDHKIHISRLPLAQGIYSHLFPEKLQEKKNREFKSYVNALQLLPKETGIAYLHLVKTNSLQQTLDIYDKIGVLHHLDLDNTCFLIQKRTDLLYKTLDKHLHSGNASMARDLIDSFLDLSLQIVRKGIIQATTVEENYGCVGNVAMLIDTGRVFTQSDLPHANRPFSQEFKAVTHHMEKWLSKRDPDLAAYFQERMLQAIENETSTL